MSQSIVVLYPGFLFSKRIFDTFLPELQEILKGYLVEAVDVPGQGVRGGSEAGQRLDRGSDIVGSFITQEVERLKDYEQVILVGWSLGGYIAERIAQKMPVKCLFLISAGYMFIQDEEHKQHFLGLKELFIQYPEQGVKQFKKLLFSVADRKSLHFDSIKALVNESIVFDSSIVPLYLDVLEQWDIQKNSLHCPVIMIHGEADLVIPAIKQAHIILATGHMPFLFQKEKVLEIIIGVARNENL